MRRQFATFGFWFTGPLVALVVIAGAASVATAVAEAEPTDAEATVETETAPASTSGAVSRSVLTSGISDREPIDRVTGLTNNVTRIYYFTELIDLEGETVAHRWEYNGQVMAEVAFDVGAARWRVSSSKNLDPIWLGEWTVSVVDSQGNSLHVDHFLYTPPDS